MVTRIGISLGDPAGVGPEIVAGALLAADAETCARVVVFGDRVLLERALSHRGATLPPGVDVDDRGAAEAAAICPGAPSEASGRAQVDYLEAAVAAARAGRIGGLVTAPISKSWAARAGFRFPGHTEYLADRLGAPDVAMMFAGPGLRVVLVTVHVALAEVSARLTADLVDRRVQMAARTLMRDFGVSRPRVGVVGLNPHAGEGGMFGGEEAAVIVPGIDAARRALGDAVDIRGPLVPDAAFRAALAGDHDVLVAMYHDQALIPVKLIDFEEAVNVTLGLPIVRTSPDHGTAYDIAGSGRARVGSFSAALRLACELTYRRAIGRAY